ncbi:MAG: type IV toxin-antitoxin system AbiEi family antitoxin domain-containing protein [Marinilabiliaceae bacterium]|nr:type IV toxin-antitoxin system AbiEi family antitoxin domain-containing protein [Marinilabiliaceae bacterium]MBN2819101.1 type IV toxin-antitoxin system AbiEi family antitoxin domain-containing protein [Bacteroidales bacterium]
MDSIDDYIVYKVEKSKKGTIFFSEDFLSFGSAKAVGKALERLAEKGRISRVARGLYACLDTHDIFGEVQPTTEEIAKAIAKRDKARIIPTGILALNVLGLSSQVPLNTVYLTDGSARTIKVGKRTIKFKKTSPKNLAAIGNVSSLVIQALKEIGKDKITEDEIKIVLKQLKKEEPDRLEHDVKLAPEWIRIIMRKALNNQGNE